jgi:hypothetical protein
VLTPRFQVSQYRARQHQDRHHPTPRAIRQKHVPRYLAEFAYRFNHRYDLAAMIPPMPTASNRPLHPQTGPTPSSNRPHSILKPGKKSLALFQLNSNAGCEQQNECWLRAAE